MRSRPRALATLSLIAAVLLGSAWNPASASAVPAEALAGAAVPGPVVLLGTGGLSWTDVDSQRTALAGLRQRDASGWLAARSVRSLTCPPDGWLAVSAGRRAADLQVGPAAGAPAPSCREPQLQVSTPGGPATVAQWPAYLHQADDDTYEAHPGLLGTTLARAGTTKTTAAVGPGAAIALADARGVVAHAWAGGVNDAGAVDPAALAADVKSALATNPDLLIVDLGPIRDPSRRISGEPTPTGAFAASRAQQVTALDDRLGLILAELPANATLIIASMADSGPPAELQLLAASGPAPGGETYSGALLSSRSTRQDGIAQTTDLLPTLLSALDLPVPDEAVGTAVRPVEQGSSASHQQRKLTDVGQAASAAHSIVPWFVNGMVVGQVLLYGVAALVLRRRRPDRQHPGSDPAAHPPGRSLSLRLLHQGCVVTAGLPAATFLANLLPWWRAPSPALALTGATALFGLVIAGLALLGPWRRELLGPVGAVAGVTAAVLGADVVTGSHLMLSSLLGVNPIVAGRFYGFGNLAFAVFVTGALVFAVALADALIRRGRPGRAAAAVALVGMLTVICDGTPGFGSDFGGPPAVIPAFAVLTLLVAGVKVTGRRVLLIAGVTIAVILALGLVDWLRPAPERTHLGRFVQTAIDGGAWSVVRRKGEANLRLLVTSWLTVILPAAAALIGLVLARPVAAGTAADRPLLLAWARSPVLRQGMAAFAVMMVLAAGLNDSGLPLVAMAATVAVPLLIAVCVRALELSGPADPALLAGAHPVGPGSAVRLPDA